jgi:hypothetical protein
VSDHDPYANVPLHEVLADDRYWTGAGPVPWEQGVLRGDTEPVYRLRQVFRALAEAEEVRVDHIPSGERAPILGTEDAGVVQLIIDRRTKVGPPTGKRNKPDYDAFNRHAEGLEIDIPSVGGKAKVRYGEYELCRSVVYVRGTHRDSWIYEGLDADRIWWQDANASGSRSYILESLRLFGPLSVGMVAVAQGTLGEAVDVRLSQARRLRPGIVIPRQRRRTIPEALGNLFFGPKTAHQP